MRRATSRTTADRLSTAGARVTVESVNDQPMMQEIGVKALHDEATTTLEHFHPYGFTAVPKAPDGKKKAEGVVLFLNGSRSHGLVVVVGDRRYRLTGSQSGEVAIHDDQGQKVHLTRGGIVISGGASKLPVNVEVGNATLTVADGKIEALVNKTPLIVTDGMIYFGGDPNKGDILDFVQTVSAPATNVKAKIG